MASRPPVPFVRLLVSVAALALVIASSFAALPGCASKHNSSGGGGGTPKELDSGDFTTGTTFSHTFANAGAYGYHCNIHGSMTGTVTVDASAPGMTADVTITTTAPFAAASVKPGGTVTWHNNSGMTHTVTSN